MGVMCLFTGNIMNSNDSIVDTKSKLLEVIKRLSNEYPNGFENLSVPDFLEALGAWMEDSEGYYKNLNLTDESSNPSWQLFADALKAATIYE